MARDHCTEKNHYWRSYELSHRCSDDRQQRQDLPNRAVNLWIRAYRVD